MAVTITIRARLKADPTSMQKVHDEVTGATKEMAQQAGDISHRVFLCPQDHREFLGIDVWQTAEQAQAFSGDPRIQQFFEQLFEGQPTIEVWEESSWNRW